MYFPFPLYCLLASFTLSSALFFLFTWAFYVIIQNINGRIEALAMKDKVKELSVEIMEALAHTIDAKDEYTRGHSVRVANYSKKLAEEMGLSAEDCESIYYMGLLHDLGKIGVPNEIINSISKLSEEQYSVIKKHPGLGYDILAEIKSRPYLTIGARWHHERYDGKGYPNGLVGEVIPEVARIIAVADAYDAMASNRSYRDMLPQEIVREEIIKGKGTQFDPNIAEIMLEIMDEDEEYELRQSDDSVHHILVIDDDTLILSYVKELLRSMTDVHVSTASTVLETFTMLANSHIELIIMDLMMPEIDGFTLYSEIKETYDIPVILMTSERSVEILQRIRELGIDDYLTKPLNTAVTRETVHGILHRTMSKIDTRGGTE